MKAFSRHSPNLRSNLWSSFAPWVLFLHLAASLLHTQARSFRHQNGFNAQATTNDKLWKYWLPRHHHLSQPSTTQQVYTLIR